MSTASWWVAIALAAVYAPAGLMKLVVPKSRLVSNPQFGWAAAMSDPAVKAIGAAEVLGAVGVIAPRLTGVAPALGVAAAWGLAAVQVGAIIVHVRRREYATLPINVVLLALAVVLGAGLV
ncbi:DoxX family protein [Mycolicibacterium sp.]|uniref:DoxX family protein n=1 Tax=Mycolicibacterium sp. TaxID=2320850 RepID=UPI0028AA0EA5|nr:DoxX family protein [Mycolicibacterium sp.]